MINKKIRIIFSILILNFFLVSCQSLSNVGKSLRNEKTRTSDEFLIQKKKPLAEPPDYRTLPEPKSANSEEKKDSELKSILKVSEKNKKFGKSKSSTAEDSILGQIRK